LQTITILRPGMLTTIQDLGRWGRQGSGVPVAGPMDEYSHILANHLVGNDPGRAALEITLIGPELQSNADLVCAVAGAAFNLLAGQGDVPMHEPFTLRAGARLRFGSRSAGARATLAVRGGIDVEPVFGSRSTSLISRVGPFGGRALAAGAVLPIAAPQAASPGRDLNARPVPLALPHGGAILRVVPGPQEHMFTQAAYDTLFGSRFLITPNSNRMGYRLEGASLTHAGGADILSDATPIGSIQVPASGQPILLMADRQTTGGYPKIATVIGADLPVAGQLAPGDWIEFRPCTREEAIEALRARYRWLSAPVYRRAGERPGGPQGERR
jgi:antagonist of KipI